MPAIHLARVAAVTRTLRAYGGICRVAFFIFTFWFQSRSGSSQPQIRSHMPMLENLQVSLRPGLTDMDSGASMTSQPPLMNVRTLTY